MSDLPREEGADRPADPANQTPPPPPPPPPASPSYPAAPTSAASSAPSAPAGPGAALSSSDERTWSMFAHLGGIVLGFVAPLIVMLVQGERSPAVRRQSVEALNFQITVVIAYVVAFVLSLLLIGLLLLPLIWVATLVFCILAGMAANRGEDYRYPVSLRLVK